MKRLLSLFGFVKREEFLKSHREWIEEELRNGLLERNPLWDGSVAVGSELFLKDIQQKLSGKVQGRGMVTNGRVTALHEPQPSYNTLFDHQNSILRDEIIS